MAAQNIDKRAARYSAEMSETAVNMLFAGALAKAHPHHATLTYYMTTLFDCQQKNKEILFVTDTDQGKSFGWGGRPGCFPVAGIQNLLHPLRRILPVPDLDQGTRNDPYHIIQETCPGNPYGDDISVPVH